MLSRLKITLPAAKRDRRIATRYEKLAVTFPGFGPFAKVHDVPTHEA